MQGNPGDHNPTTMQPARRCPSCHMDFNSYATGLFFFICAAICIGLVMELYMHITIDATAKSALRSFVNYTVTVDGGVQGLGQDLRAEMAGFRAEMAGLRARLDKLEHSLLENITAELRAIRRT